MEYFQHRLQLIDLVENVFHRRADVLIMNEAPLRLRFQVYQHGVPVYLRDEEEALAFECSTLARYYTFRPIQSFRMRNLLKNIQTQGVGYGYQGHHDALAAARRISKKLAAAKESI